MIWDFQSLASQYIGDHHLNQIGSVLWLASCVGFGLISATSAFQFKSGFKLRNIRKLYRGHRAQQENDGDLNWFGKFLNVAALACGGAFVVGGAMMFIPF